MKLSELIEKAQKILEKEGNLDVLTSNQFSVGNITVHEFEEDIPDWDIKSGDKVAEIHECN